MNLDNIYNFDDVWIRNVSVSLCKSLTKNIRWINRFSEGGENNEGLKRRVLCPFYLSIPGDERFVLDAWVDDIRGERVELNTDQLPRAVVTFNSASPVSSEFANPNQYLSQQSHINSDIRNIVSKVKAVPMNLNYTVEMRLTSERDSYMALQKLLDTIYNYMFFRLDYYGLNIDAVMLLPDDESIEIPREIDMTTETTSVLKFNLNVKSYYPIFKINIDDLEVCDNDDDLDWDRLYKKRPSEMDANDISSVRRVYWKSYIWDYDYRNDKDKLKGDNERKDTPPENF